MWLFANTHLLSAVGVGVSVSHHWQHSRITMVESCDNSHTSILFVFCNKSSQKHNVCLVLETLITQVKCINVHVRAVLEHRCVPITSDI